MEMDVKALLEMLTLSAIKKQDEKAYKAIKVLKKYGLSVMDAIAALAEISIIMQGDEDGGNNE